MYLGQSNIMQQCNFYTIRYGTVSLGYDARCTVTATLGYVGLTTVRPS